MQHALCLVPLSVKYAKHIAPHIATTVSHQWHWRETLFYQEILAFGAEVFPGKCEDGALYSMVKK